MTGMKFGRITAGDEVHMRNNLLHRAPEIAGKYHEHSLVLAQDLSPENALRMIHELQVRQIELEMRNEELSRMHRELEISRERYIKLYDWSPVGYITLDGQGLITDANLKFARLMNKERTQLLLQPFFQLVARQDQDIAYSFSRSLVQNGARQVCEVRLEKADGALAWVRIEAGVTKDAAGKILVHAVVSDIDERKKADRELLRNSTIKLLLRTVADSATRSMPLETLYLQVQRLVGSVLPVKIFLINLLDEATGEIVNRYYGDELDSNSGQSQIDPELTRYIMRQGRAMLLKQDDLESLREAGECTLQNMMLYEILGAPLIDSNGKSFGIIAVALTDETESFQEEDDLEMMSIVAAQISQSIESRLAQEKLLKSGEYFRCFVENSSDLLFSLTRQGVFDYVSPQIHKLTDYDADEIVGRPFSYLIHPEDKARCRSQLNRVLHSTDRQCELEYRFHHKNGAWRLYRANISVLRGVNGIPDSYIAIARDITENRKVFDAKWESAELFLTLLQNFPSVAIQGFEEDGQITYWNQTSERIFGYSSKEAIGHNFINLIVAPEKRASTETALLQMVNSSQPIGASELNLVRKDGVVLPVFASFTVIKGHGGICRSFCVGFDMSDQKRVESELADMCRKAEAASKAKSRFLANMSHELRTPLNAIIGFSEVLKDKLFGPLNKKQEKYINDILVSAKHQLSLVTDILDLSKVESGKMELEISKINIKEICQSTVAMLRDKAMRQKVNLCYKVDAAIDGVPIFADGRRIKQILYNLVSNAIKFNKPDGSVTVSVIKENGGFNHEVIKIMVEDTGIGIAGENMDKLFRPFVQIGRTYSEQSEGTGLGLALTKHLVELHHGQIFVESEPDKGSRFTVVLPVHGGAA